MAHKSDARNATFVVAKELQTLLPARDHLAIDVILLAGMREELAQLQMLVTHDVRSRRE